MKNRTKYIFLICFIFFTQAIQSKPEIRHGLSFKSYEVKKEERTGLNLSSEGHLSFQDGFILEFDATFRKAHYNFGYIFRIVGQNDKHIDLLLSKKKEIADPNITAICRSREILFDQSFEELDVDFDTWMHVKLIIDCEKGLLRLFLNDTSYEKTDDYFKEFNVVDILFGMNDHVHFLVSDVPAMSVKDITIKNLEEKPVYCWKLSQHTPNGVYDEIKGRFASCENPDWILDYHSFWQKETTFTTGPNPQLCFNQQDNMLAVIDKHSFYSYNTKNGDFKQDAFKEGFPSGSNANQLLYDPLIDRFFTYDFKDEVAVYDIQNRVWNNNTLSPTDPSYWHHNRFFSTRDTTLYTFGGYGFHLYKDDINTYHFPTKTWNKVELQGDVKISARYLSGSGMMDDKTVLIFGGYGNREGNQELSPHNYYDLYTYNTETSTVKKIWELDQNKHNFVVANSLVVDTLEGCFYALCFPHQKYNTNMQLYRFSLSEPKYEILADSIPFSFNDNFSYADLYLSNDKEQLIAVTSNTSSGSEDATISVYTLAYPPLNKVDLYQQETVSSSLTYIIGTVLGAIALFAIFVFMKRKKRVLATKTAAQPSDENTVTKVVLSDKPVNDKPTKQCILLFGGFQVMDKESKDVTGEFAPILKQLFLLILLYTLKDGKGISSVKLREILWFDKSNESAKNNRGVSMSKLRVLFEKVGEVSISGQSSYWTVQFGNDIYCDYYEALTLMDRISVNPVIADIKRLASIVSAGELLPNLQTEWVDPFKSNFSNKLIDLLLNILANATALKLSPSLMIDIADAVFVHDSLNEDALKIKCTLLLEMGKNGLAQKTYTSFIKEYQSLFGADFKYTFEQIIS
ncbi:hypothetical protein [Bacteroides sp. 51]|uniref:hypothetical protein n=1 Tax=Bacteroides sp. 51 TaxID=2302938 RepID=UPI0013D37518|nr:hypothetical protein [Bacteroides sp. 51]NDV82866.1 hypothetical protein [Bacteroides sp. 51]